jgi:hypothetical protein
MWNEMFAPNWMRDNMSGSMAGSGCGYTKRRYAGYVKRQSGVASREAERRRGHLEVKGRGNAIYIFRPVSGTANVQNCQERH